jgi:flagellar hook-associated protein 1 FlgK
MGIPNIMNAGQSGLIAAKAAIATTGHNINNANTDGYSRQRVITEAAEPRGGQFGKNTIGTGVRIARVERINDEYVEKQLRNSQRDLSNCEEKDGALRQVEDIFNEMNGDGLNRLISRFFNEFRKLSNEPESPAVRQSVREASQAMVNDFHRLRQEVDNVREHLDARIEGYSREVNSLSTELAELNQKIRLMEPLGGPPNDLLDKRDTVLKKLGSYLDLASHKDKQGNVNIDIRDTGPLISDGQAETLSVERSPADDQGKPDNAFDIKTTGYVPGILTHQIKGGKLGALLDARDKTVSTILNRLDDMAYNLTEAVNEVHSQGVTLEGTRSVAFFKPMYQRERAAEFLSLSNEVKASVNNIATAIEQNSPGDNRVAIAISRLQNEKLMDDGFSTLDEWYNGLVSDVGVATARNHFALNQQKDIMTQLTKVRDQISGVSIDEETANLLQYQHAFDASAKVIQVADDLLKTVLALKRD